MKMYLPPPGQRDSRRRFLKRGFFGTALLSLGSATFLLSRPSQTLSVPTGFQVLDEKTYAIVVALVPCFHPIRSEFPDAMSLGVPKAVDDILAMLDEANRTDLVRLLLLLENGLPNFLFSFRAKAFTAQTEAQQLENIEGWRTSRLTLRRTGFLALRTVMMGAYYGNPGTWNAVGYPGPPAGIFDSQAPVFKGGTEVRPLGNGSFVEEVTP